MTDFFLHVVKTVCHNINGTTWLFNYFNYSNVLFVKGLYYLHFENLTNYVIELYL